MAPSIFFSNGCLFIYFILIFFSFFVFSFFFFYILIVYHREHVLIFSWHQKRSIFTHAGCLVVDCFRWIKKTTTTTTKKQKQKRNRTTTLACHSLHVLPLISVWSHCAAIWIGKGRRMERGKKKAAATFLSSGQHSLLRAVKKKECTVLIHDGMRPWQLLQGRKINSDIFFSLFSFLVFFLF